MNYTVSVSSSSDGRRRRVITTERTVLRGAKTEDVDDLFVCFSDADVMRYWDCLPHTSIQQSAAWLTKMTDSPQNGMTDFVIVLRDGIDHDMNSISSPRTTLVNGKVIGKAGIWKYNEIGFLLARGYWGKGLASEVLNALIDVAFGFGLLSPPVETSSHNEQAGACGDEGRDQAQKIESNTEKSERELRREITADVDPRNGGCLKLLKKLGFQAYASKEQTFKIGDEWVDSVYLSLSQETWRARMGS